jgi:Sigma-70, region 4
VPRTRPPYPPEFRREAIELARISSKSQRQIAEDLGLSDVTLRNWVEPGIPGSTHYLDFRIMWIAGVVPVECVTSR